MSLKNILTFLLYCTFLLLLSSCDDDNSNVQTLDTKEKAVNQISPPVKTTSDNILENITSLEGTDGEGGKIVFTQGFKLPPSWNEGAISFIPASSQLPNGLTLKIKKISSSEESITVIYSQPSIDELLQ